MPTDHSVEYRINDVLDNLDDLGFKDFTQDLDAQGIHDLLEAGFTSSKLRTLLAAVANNIAQLDGAQGTLFISKDDEEEFGRAIVSFLSHYGYPYGGDPRADKLRLLEFLISELQATRLLIPDDAMEIDTFELPEQVEPIYIFLKRMCEDLGVPFDKVAPTQAIKECSKHIQDLVKQLPPNYISPPILASSNLNPQEMKTLEEIQAALDEEYKQRFIVLRKRLEVTLQSFMWSDKAKEKEAEIKKVIRSKLRNFPAAPTVTLHELFSAQPEVAKIAKTSNVATKSNSDLKSVLIGSVPDRGGRPGGRREASMPSFKARETEHPQEQRASRRGRIQGGWHGAKEGKGGGGGGHHEDEQEEGGGGRRGGRGGHGGGHKGGRGGGGGGGWGGARGGRGGGRR